MILMLGYTGMYSKHSELLTLYINVHRLALWETISGGSIQVPTCGPTVAGAALYFSNSNVSQYCLTKVLDLTGIRFVSFLIL